jgi:hypothetical protein
MSRKAFNKLKDLVYQAMDQKESIELIVDSRLRGNDSEGKTVPAF